ncbi:MAG: glutamine amidotransferase [Phycisphaerales bacterium]|nr:glutamine amidotransferase [Phycisphaerales bacterium]
MFLVADIQLEFLSQSFWWIAIVGIAGIALLIHAFLLRRDTPSPPGATGLRSSQTRAGSRTSAIAAVPERLTLLGFPLSWVAAIIAIAAMLLTIPVAMLNPALGHGPLAMSWTLLVLIVAVYLFYRRVYHYLPRVRMVTLFALRTLGMITLTMLLFQPVLGFIKTPESRSKLAIIVDASGSMSYSDAPNQPNRYRQAAIAVQNTLVPRLEKNFDLQIFAYDGKHSAPLKSSDELDQIAPNGESTDLGAAMALAANATQAVLISDGIHNGTTTIDAELGSITIPVHTVRVGSSDVEPSTVPDIAVVAVEGPQTATVNNLVTLTASIKSTALSDRTIKVILQTPTEAGAEGGGGGTVLDEQRLVLRSGPTPQTVQLKFTPDKVGRTTVRVRVPVDPGERSEANNQQDFPLLITDPKLAVLYIEGRVRPEVGPLRRMLDQDPNVSAISMVQMQAGKFELRGTKPGDDLKGLPTTLAQWKRFKVIILGDLDASFLSPQQQKDLEQAVREGSGLLMIGGQNSFAPGGWGNTTLATLLPVSLDRVQPPQLDTKFVPQLTAAGNVHPIFRNITQFFIAPDGRKGGGPSQQMPELDGCVALAAPKPGAVVLAVHPTDKINGALATVLAVQQFGQGRTAAFAADTTWHWNLFLRAMEKDSPYNRFWGQMVRWLASHEDLQKKTGPSVTAMLAKERYEAGEPVTLRAAVTDKEGQSTNYATVRAEVTGPDGKTSQVPLTAKSAPGSASGSSDTVGIYEAVYHPKMSATYTVTFKATKDKSDLGKDQTTLVVLAAASEKEVLAAQPQILQLISHTTHARHIELAAVTSLADTLAASLPPAAIATKTTFPLYHNRIFFFAFIACFATEWFLRRKWQLQ